MKNFSLIYCTRVFPLILFLFLLVFNGCTESSSEQVTPAKVTKVEFQSLRWLEGIWRGTGVETSPFFEVYHFTNDSTIKFSVYGDSSLTELMYDGRIILSNGTVTYQSGESVWVATELGSNQVHFDPRQNASNNFTWVRGSSSVWIAVLSFPGQTGHARERVYRLERIKGNDL